MLLKMSEEPDDFEGPWPKGDAMSEWKLVPVEPAPSQVASGECEVPDPLSHRAANVARNVYRAMLDAAPAAPQQAEPAAQIGWADEFGNLFPMGAWKPTQRTHHDSHKTAWRPVFLHPHADEVQRLRAALEEVFVYGNGAKGFIADSVRKIARRALRRE